MRMRRSALVAVVVIAGMAITGAAMFIKSTQVRLFSYSSGEWLKISEIERGRDYSIIHIAYTRKSGSVADSVGIICGVADLVKERGFDYFSVGAADENNNRLIRLFASKAVGDKTVTHSPEKVISVEEMLMLQKSEQASAGINRHEGVDE